MSDPYAPRGNKHPRPPDPMRAALVRDRWVTGCDGNGAPTYEARIQCDDGVERAFVSGAEGRWVLKDGA
jgi:hypothetical protein